MNRRRLLAGVVLLTIFLSATIGMQSNASAVSQDSPHLEVSKAVSPEEIKLKQTGSASEKARVTLEVKGVGKPFLSSFPIDVMLIADRSGSMAEQNRLENAISAGTILVGHLNPEKDRSGLVSFATTATQDIGLTSNQIAVQEALSGLTASGYSATGDAIHLATKELTSNGRSDAVWVEVLRGAVVSAATSNVSCL